MEKYWAWHFPHTTQYDPVTKTGGLWAECINLWLTGKQEADGYPSWCHTEEDRQRYISDYYDREGIRLNPEKIEKNEGL